MANHTVTETPLLRLIRELSEETRTLIKQEVKLAKTEMAERASHFGQNAAKLAIGGVIAYAGLIVLLAGLGALIAYALEQAGLERTLASFAGLGIIGFLVALVGALLALKALKTMKRESLAPERTIRTLQQLSPAEAGRPPMGQRPEEEAKRSSRELQANVNVTQAVMGEHIEELGRRMTPQYVGQVVRGQVRVHPMRSLAVAFGTGLAGSFMLVRRLRHRARAHA